MAALPSLPVALSPNEAILKMRINNGYKDIGSIITSLILTPSEPEIITTNQTGKPNKLSINKNVNPKYEPGLGLLMM